MKQMRSGLAGFFIFSSQLLRAAFVPVSISHRYKLLTLARQPLIEALTGLMLVRVKSVGKIKVLLTVPGWL